MTTYIDIVKNTLRNIKNIEPCYTFSHKDSNNFNYDIFISNSTITIYINNSNIGYEFIYSNNEIIWTHSDGAEGLLSDEVKNYLSMYLKNINL